MGLANPNPNPNPNQVGHLTLTLALALSRCTAIKLILVHDSIAEAFVSRLAAAVGQLSQGLPWERGVTITPLPEPKKPAYLQALLIWGDIGRYREI